MSNSIADDPDTMYAALWAAVGALLVFAGRRSYAVLLEGGVVGVAIAVNLFVGGIALVGVATVGGPDALREWATPLTVWVIASLLGLGVWTWVGFPVGRWGSDQALFEAYATTLILRGEHPMAADMLTVREAWPATTLPTITPTLAGGRVSSYSYPGGSLVWTTIEQALVPGRRLGLGAVVASVGALTWLVARVEAGLVPLALIAWLAPISRVFSAGLGMITPFWLLPLLVGVAAWYDGRLTVAAIALGAAAATKQLVWPIAGLVWLHVWRTQGRRAGGRVAGVAVGSAAVLVGWLVVWNPGAWAYAALFPILPIGEPLIAQGVGLTALTTGDVVTVPRTVHRILTVGMAVGLVKATWRWPARMQWAIPFATLAVLVVHHRTLPSYYAATVPLAVVALDAHLRDGTPRPTPWTTRVRTRLTTTGGVRG